jgi:hypothetical protein
LVLTKCPNRKIIEDIRSQLSQYPDERKVCFVEFSLGECRVQYYASGAFHPFLGFTMLTLLLALANATPYQETWPEVIGSEFSPDLYQELLEQAAGRAPVGTTHVEVLGAGVDGVFRSLESFLPKSDGVGERQPMNAPVDLPGQAGGGLTGRALYLSQCHGWIWYTSLNGFSTQRQNHYSTVEDFHNPEGLNQYLIPMLENAGAAVFTAKERDLNPLMAIVDQGDVGYLEEGSGFVDGDLGFAHGGPWAYGENPFDAGTTRRFPAGGGGRVEWTPEVPQAGQYAIYVSWDSAADNSPRAHYRFHHPGGVIDRYFDQRVHGSTWQYAERLWLPEGPDGLRVELVGDSEGQWLSADAVRIGGGWSDVSRNGQLSERPRWEGGAIQYIQWNGAPKAVYDPYNDGNGSDPSSRSLWAAWEHPTGEDALYLSWHSNAGGGQGTSTYYYGGSSSPVAGSAEFAALVQEEVVSVAQTKWDPSWTSRGVKTAAFSEVSPNHNPEMPSVLLEWAFHDLESDVAVMLEPEFRQDTARALYRAIVRYFADRDGQSAEFLPEAPVAVAALQEVPGAVVLSWSAGPVGDPYGDIPMGYRVYHSVDGLSWDNGVEARADSLTLEIDPGQHYFRVAAFNDAGASFTSEIVGIRSTPDPVQPVLIVAAFDRQQASMLPWEAVGRSVGDVRRMDLERMNRFDVAVAHGTALKDLGWGFDTISDERLGTVDLAAYSVVIWVAGEESTANETFSHSQQDLIRSYVEGGGHLLVSGAEILWDLDERGDAADKAFALEVLGASLGSDDSGSNKVAGVGVLSALILDFSEADGAPYPVEYPDVLASDGEPLAYYGTGDLAGAMSGNVALFGFPLETIGSEEVRMEVFTALLRAMVPDYSVPDGGWGDTGGGDTGGGGSEKDANKSACACAATGGYPVSWWPFLWVLAYLVCASRRNTMPTGVYQRKGSQ